MYLSSIRQLQIAHGFKYTNFDEMPRLCQIIKGVQIDQARKGQTPCPRLPITTFILCKIKYVWLPKDAPPDRLMLWAAPTTAFFGFCRSGEVTISSEGSYDPQSHLSFSDLAAQSTDPSMISILLKHSKTDQARKVKLLMIMPSSSSSGLPES